MWFNQAWFGGLDAEECGVMAIFCFGYSHRIRNFADFFQGPFTSHPCSADAEALSEENDAKLSIPVAFRHLRFDSWTSITEP